MVHDRLYKNNNTGATPSGVQGIDGVDTIRPADRALVSQSHKRRTRMGAQPPTRQLCAHAQIATKERRNTSTGTPDTNDRASRTLPIHWTTNYLSLLLLGVIKYNVTGTTNTHTQKTQGSKWDTYWSTVLFLVLVLPAPIYFVGVSHTLVIV